MNCLVLISCCWLLNKTLVIPTNVTTPESASDQVIKTPYQKQLEIFLDHKFNFGEQFNNIINKVNTSIGLLRKLQKLLTRRLLVTIFKSFIRHQLGYEDAN